MAPSKHVLAYLRWSSAKLEHGIRAYAREAGWTLSFMRHVNAPPPASRKVDGVILLSGPEPIDVRDLYPCAKIVDLRNKTSAADAHVATDQDKIARLAADHLHGLGFRNFLGFACKPVHPITRRLDSFKQRLVELGAEATLLYSGHWPEQIVIDPDHLKERLAREINHLGLPLAVFAADDDYATAFIQVALEMGYRIPEDIVVLGANNDPTVCETCPVPLSSIDINLGRLGHESARVLDRLMRGDADTPLFTLIPPLGIETRASTRAPVASDQMVSAIRGYLHEHFSKKITTRAVLQDLRIARSTAFQKFKISTGRTMRQEITRVRLEHARRLLAETDYKIDAVARMSGYANTSAFCRLFRRVYHESPAVFREKAAMSAGAEINLAPAAT